MKKFSFVVLLALCFSTHGFAQGAAPVPGAAFPKATEALHTFVAQGANVAMLLTDAEGKFYLSNWTAAGFLDLVHKEAAFETNECSYLEDVSLVGCRFEHIVRNAQGAAVPAKVYFHYTMQIETDAAGQIRIIGVNQNLAFFLPIE